jgi:hypothetical protein
MNFLNAAYLPVNPYNEQVYEYQSLTMNDILTVVWKHTDIVNEKTAQDFSKWCGNKKLNLMKATTKRRFNEIQQKTSIRSLYVLKNEFFGKTYCIYFCWPIINASFRTCNRRHR